MALTKLTADVENIQKLADKPTESATQVKVIFDKAGTDIKTYLNDTLVPELESMIDGASGADKIGMTPIASIGSQATPQSIIEAFVTRLQAVTATSGAKFIGVQSISGLTGNDVQVLLSALKTYIDNHKTSSDHDSRYFTETELGATTDSASGADKIGATPISSSPSTVQGILEWLNTQINTIVSGGISDGSVTDAKLSNTTGQIKERVATHTALSSSETVKGHVELATVAETTTGTDNTRAVHPAGLKNLMDAHTTLSASETVKAHVELANQSEVSLGASTSLVVTPVTLKGIFTTIITASDNLRASADTELSISNQSVWVKMKAFTIAKTGTYRVKFAIRESSMSIIYGMIYKNGVAYGTQRQATSGLVTFSEDLVFNAGDTCEMWIKGGGTGTGYVSNFRIYFDAAYSVDFTMTPNIPALTYGT